MLRTLQARLQFCCLIPLLSLAEPTEVAINVTLSSLGGLELLTFRLTAERANRLRHRDSSTGFFWTLSGVDTHFRGERSVPQRNGAVFLPLLATDASAPGETSIQASKVPGLNRSRSKHS